MKTILIFITLLFATILSYSQETWNQIGSTMKVFDMIQLNNSDFVISSSDVYKVSKEDFSFTSLDFYNQIGNTLSRLHSGALGENSKGEIFRFTPDDGIFKLSQGTWSYNGLDGYGTHGGGWTELNTGRILITKAGWRRNIYYSDNGGDNWTSVGLGDVDWASNVVLDNGDIFYSSHASGSGPKGIIKSTDNGMSWKYINDLFPPNTFPQDVYSSISKDLNSDLYVIAKETQIYKSTDNGLSWSFFSLTPDNLKSPRLFHFKNEWFLTNYHELYQSKDNGMTWNNISGSFPDDVKFHGVKFFENKVFVLTTMGLFHKNSDNDNDGVSDDVDLCPNTPTGETVNSDGCSDSQLDDDNDGVMNDDDLCPDTPTGETVDSNGCSSEITYIPDSSFEQVLIDLGIDKDFTINGQVENKYIENITELNLDTKGINDLTGIEGFINLKKLNINDNNIDALDLSKNYELIFLDCSGNTFSNLDLSNNSKLITLSLSSSIVSEINLNGVTSLEFLGLGDLRMLTQIDLSSNLNLKNVSIVGTTIESLDLSNNKKLEYLNCNGDFDNFGFNESGNLIELDLSNNINLIRVECGRNNIENLILNSNIQILYCNNNKIKDLNTSESVNLEILNCEINPIIELDLSNNEKLTNINCSNCILEELNIKNGNNSNITNFTSVNNPTLQCIQVDNETDSNSSISPYDNWKKDNTSTYSEDCSSFLSVDDEELNQSIKFYPNPVSNVLSIRSETIPINKIEIYSVLGQKIIEVNSEFSSIRTDNLLKGIYIVRIYSEKGTTVRKLIKQ